MEIDSTVISSSSSDSGIIPTTVPIVTVSSAAPLLSSVSSCSSLAQIIKTKSKISVADPKQWTPDQWKEVFGMVELIRHMPLKGVEIVDSFLLLIASLITEADYSKRYDSYDKALCGLLEAGYLQNCIGYVMLAFFFIGPDCTNEILRGRGVEFEKIHGSYNPWLRPEIWYVYDKKLNYPRMKHKPVVGTKTRINYKIHNRMECLKHNIITPTDNGVYDTSARMCVNCGVHTTGWPITWKDDPMLLLTWCQNCYRPNIATGKVLSESYKISIEVLEKCEGIYTAGRQKETSKVYLFNQVIDKRKQAELSDHIDRK